LSSFEHHVAIIQPTRCNIFTSHVIRHFFRMRQLFSRHAITSCYFTRCGVFSGLADYRADMRNTNNSFDLWPMQSSGYPADMRKSIPDQEMWPSGIFASRARACARSHMMPRSHRNVRVEHKTPARRQALRRGASGGDQGRYGRWAPRTEQGTGRWAVAIAVQVVLAVTIELLPKLCAGC
jgi:hypothetical protein